jgi:hypothetical protein
VAVQEPKTIPEVATELWQLTREYAEQETIDPIKGLGRFLGFGVGGSILLGLGFIMLSLSGLRALQTETGSTFTGNWSWAPYIIVLIGDVAIAALAVSRIGKGTKSKGAS